MSRWKASLYLASSISVQDLKVFLTKYKRKTWRKYTAKNIKTLSKRKELKNAAKSTYKSALIRRRSVTSSSTDSIFL